MAPAGALAEASSWRRLNHMASGELDETGELVGLLGLRPPCHSRDLLRKTCETRRPRAELEPAWRAEHEPLERALLEPSLLCLALVGALLEPSWWTLEPEWCSRGEAFSQSSNWRLTSALTAASGSGRGVEAAHSASSISASESHERAESSASAFASFGRSPASSAVASSSIKSPPKSFELEGVETGRFKYERSESSRSP